MRLKLRAKGEDGKNFERRIEHDCALDNITCVRINEEVRGMYTGKPIKLRAPFDYCASIDGRAIFFDAKFIRTDRLNIKTYITQVKKIHQYEALLKAKDQGSIAGYLVHFDAIQTVAWFPIASVSAAIQRGDVNLNLNTIGIKAQSAFNRIDLGALAFFGKSAS